MDMENFEAFTIQTENHKQQQFVQRLLIEEGCLLHGHYNGENTSVDPDIFNKSGLLLERYKYIHVALSNEFYGCESSDDIKCPILSGDEVKPSNIIKALNGEYEFKEEQPFDKLSNWSVQFNEDGVEIGCKTLTIDQLNTLYDAVEVLEMLGKKVYIGNWWEEDFHSQIRQAKEYYDN